MSIDGRALARELLIRTKARAEALGKVPHLLAVVANETPATHSHLAIKERRAAEAGCELEVMRLPEDAGTAELVAAVLSSAADAVIVQLPLPAGVHTNEVCNVIPAEKDADVLSVRARMKFEADEPGALLPPVASAVAKILEYGGVSPAGKKAVVIGSGWLVGKPCATWLSHAGADVAHFTLESGNESLLKNADIIVSGAGAPHFITPAMLKDGVVLVDAGTSESDGKVVGDADPACVAKCSLLTPVPGGVGPLAVACLFENTVTLTERAINT